MDEPRWSPDAQRMRAVGSHFPRSCSRRDWLLRAGGGIGALAVASLLNDQRLSHGGPRPTSAQLPSGGSPLAPKDAHFPPRARRVIWLFMHGGPSHVDLFDPKPALTRYAGQPLPASFGPVMTRRDVAQNTLLPPLKPFRPRGEAGLQVSDFLPHIADCADELCVIRSCHGDSVNHPQSVYQLNTGSILMGKPSVGSWVAYGLGSENQDLPAFIVMPQSDGVGGIKGGPPAWGSGYLPATYQGTTLRAGSTPILHLHPHRDVPVSRQRAYLDLMHQLNREHFQQRAFDDELAARVNAYELAFRMQAAAPDVVDIGDESEHTLRLYGVDEPETREFGLRCLLARRMVERGVRFVQLYSGDTSGWDAHEDVAKNHGMYCRRTDKPVAGLLRDLKMRGLMEDTLVVWGGEFGRMPMNEQGLGRDHNPWGFSYWLAGAGVKGGMAYGATDPVGLRAVENRVHVHDLHATILYLLGIDHEQLTFVHHGRQDRLTDVHGHVIRDILS